MLTYASSFNNIFVFIAQLSYAGRPMEVDDAGIVDESACQLETWGELRHGQQSYWLTPACNIGGDWEVSVGSAWQQNSDSANAKIFEAQAKTVLVEGLAERLDIALAVAYEHQRMANEHEHSWQLNLPITIELNHPAWLWHNNLGSTFDSQDNHWQLTWGTGVEHEFSDNLSFYAELFGESGERAHVQISSGYWFKPETLQLAFGAKLGDSALSAGILEASTKCVITNLHLNAYKDHRSTI